MVNQTILVIEDNELNMKLIESVLKIGNYQVSKAMSAEAGIKLAREVHPDLVLMDIQLPGMDGLEATRIIKADPDMSSIPVLALTAHAMMGDEERAKDAGCDGYIPKPIDTRNFLATVEEFLTSDDQGKTICGEHSPDHRKRILIVDDEPLNVKLLTAQLTSKHYEIFQAYSGQEALDKVTTEHPDLILLDIMMPGLDGFEVTRRVKHDPSTSNIPIILVTSLDATENKGIGLEAGADDFLNKPVNNVELLARVRSLLGLKQCRDQLTKYTAVDGSSLGLTPETDLAPEDQELPLVFLVEDTEVDAKLIKSYLQSEPLRLEWFRNGEEAMARINTGKVDLVLLDILLPGMNGFEVCRELKESESTRNIQIVAITCLRDLQSKIKGIELGVDEYLSKPINEHELKARVKALVKKKIYLDRLAAR